MSEFSAIVNCRRADKYIGRLREQMRNFPPLLPDIELMIKHGPELLLGHVGVRLRDYMIKCEIFPFPYLS